MNFEQRRGFRAALVLGAMLGGACVSSRDASSIPASTARSTVARVLAAGRGIDTVWYISARAREEGRDSRRLADSLEFGYVLHSHRANGDLVAGGLDIALEDSVRLSRAQFVEGVRVATGGPAPRDFAALYVHGFGTSLRECWQYASETHVRSQSRAPWITFCWPSNGSGVAPPTRDALFTGAYVNDSAAAVASQPAFVRATELVLEAIPSSRLMFVAHSLGSQLLGDALGVPTALQAHLTAHPARAIIFAAPDVEVTRFADVFVPTLQRLAERTVVYMSGRDRMLALSKARSGTVRAGANQRAPLLRPGLETIDATAGLVAEPGLQRWFGTHHALRRASSVIFDITHVVGARRAAACRGLLGTATMQADGVWQLTKMKPDSAMVARRCPLPHR